MGKCGNCFNVKGMKYPIHTAQECPYTTPSCLPRNDGKHTPIARINGFTDRASDPAVVDAFIKERTAYLIDLHSNPSGKESNSGKGVPQVRNVIFSPIQVPKTKDDDDDTEDNDDEINVPAEPAAKGPIRVPQQWPASAKPLKTHFMMFNIQRCLMVSPDASSRLLHWGD